MNTYTSERDTELALAKKIIQGDSEAIQIFVTQYTDDVYRFIFNQVGGVAQDAEDIVQETFIAALKSMRRFKGKSKLRTWLFSIAVHKALDQQRWYARRPQVELSEAALSNFTKGPMPELVVEKTESLQALRQALMQLPPHYRTALVLKYIEALSVQDIATVMQRSLKSVESILVRARRALATIIKDDYVTA